MVFRKDRGGDSFQRQISALRQQLGGEDEIEETIEIEPNGGIEETYVSRRYEQPVQYERERYTYEPVATEIVQAAAPSDDPSAPVIPVVDGQTTVISPNATWKGEIVAEGSMHILGKFEGDIKVRDELFILDSAEVDATVAAGTVVVSGNYNGNLSCNERLEVLPTGKIRGELFAPTLVVHNGAIINGKVKMTGSSDTTQAVPAAIIHRRTARGTA